MTVFEKIRHKLNRTAVAVQCALADRKAEGYVDTGVKIVIAIVVGTLIFAMLVMLTKGIVMLKTSNMITSLFNYSGT